jgi:hypothetical protein
MRAAHIEFDRTQRGAYQLAGAQPGRVGEVGAMRNPDSGIFGGLNRPRGSMDDRRRGFRLATHDFALGTRALVGPSSRYCCPLSERRSVTTICHCRTTEQRKLPCCPFVQARATGSPRRLHQAQRIRPLMMDKLRVVVRVQGRPRRHRQAWSRTGFLAGTPVAPALATLTPLEMLFAPNNSAHEQRRWHRALASEICRRRFFGKLPTEPLRWTASHWPMHIRERCIQVSQLRFALPRSPQRMLPG